jgi:hypothetical protein
MCSSFDKSKNADDLNARKDKKLDYKRGANEDNECIQNKRIGVVKRCAFILFN